MDLGIDGRVALVLGASRGLGRAVAEALGREGARVALAARSVGELEAAAAGIDGETAVVAVDTGDAEAVAALPDRVASALGPVEILVLNTGGPPGGPALDADLETWTDAYRSLVLAPVILAEAVRARDAGPRLGTDRLDLGRASIREPIPNLTLSNANRAATAGFLATLAREAAADGVTVNTIATGRFATERLASSCMDRSRRPRSRARADVPAGRLGRPDEYGDLVAFVCSERAAYLTGTTIPLDGGLTRSS